MVLPESDIVGIEVAKVGGQVEDERDNRAQRS
jgi:hypothetical protein